MSGMFVHRLWTAVSLLATIGCLVQVWAERRGERAARGRTAALLATERTRGRAGSRAVLGGWARRWGPVLAAFLVVWFLVGGALGAG
ncbi:type II secretion protein F, partial [Streptomyces sp. 8L]|nr:type II secretion protein F [Streptomyces sp. 8L]